MEIAARAWEQLGVVPGDVFRSIQNELEVVAKRISSEGLNDLTPGTPVTITDGQYQAQYVLDLEEQMVVLQRVARRKEEKDDLTATGKRRRR